MKYLQILFIVIAIALALVARADSLWPLDGTALCVDTKACKVGDLLTVIIDQDSSSSTQAKHTTSKGMNVNANAGTGMLDSFLGFGSTTDRSTSGAGASVASTRFFDRLTVSVVEVLPNGNLKIEGKRTMKLEKDEMNLVFTGLVRPQDVQADNSVPSMYIADQRLEAAGLGPIAEKQRPGIISRLLSFLW